MDLNKAHAHLYRLVGYMKKEKREKLIFWIASLTVTRGQMMEKRYFHWKNCDAQRD